MILGSENIRRLHLVGICGTAMGALAVLLKDSGYHVTGSDSAVYPPMSDVLREHGIPVAGAYAAANLTPAPDLVVIGNALSRGNEEVESILERKLPFISLPEALREFFIRGNLSLVVTGTHGKTTTSSLLAWVLQHAGYNPGFMIGGVPENFGVGAQRGDGRFFVTEGDEYDTAFFDKRSKFVHYMPDIVILNNIEFDHADIFASIEEIELSFRRLLALVPRNGLLVANSGDPRVARLTETAWAPRTTFSLLNGADWTARNLRDTPTGTRFELVSPAGAVSCSLPLFGRHNVSNALAVAAACDRVGLPLEAIAEGFATFRGVRRRLQKLFDAYGLIVYDDFAHHPTAISGTLRGVRAAHPKARVWALFEPRSNTTVRKFFQDDLVEALGTADVVCIGGVHRIDKIAPDDRLDVGLLTANLRAAGADAWQTADVPTLAAEVASRVRPGDVIVIMSNGAFGGLGGILREALVERFGRSEGSQC